MSGRPGSSPSPRTAPTSRTCVTASPRCSPSTRSCAGTPRPRRSRQHQRKALVNDLWLYVRDLCRVSDDYLAEYFDLVGSLPGPRCARACSRSLPATHKLAYHLTRRRLREPLLELHHLAARPAGGHDPGGPPARQAAGGPAVSHRSRAAHPAPGLPAALAGPRPVRRRWRASTWQRGNLVIAGLAYVPSIDISKRRYTNKIVILRPRRRFRPPIVSLAASSRHPRATVLSGQDRYDYAWAGFRCEISSRWFRVAGPLADRGLGLLHPGPRPRRVAARPAAQPGPGRRGPARLPRAGAGRAGPPHLGGPSPARGGAAHPGPAGRRSLPAAATASATRGGPGPGRGRAGRVRRRAEAGAWPARAAHAYRHSAAEMRQRRARRTAPLACG